MYTAFIAFTIFMIQVVLGLIILLIVAYLDKPNKLKASDVAEHNLHRGIFNSCECGGYFGSLNDFAVHVNRFSGAYVRCCDKCGKIKNDTE